MEFLMSKAHKVRRLISEKVDNKPLLVIEPVLKDIVHYLENREESYNPETALLNDESQRSEMIMGEDIAVIPVHGTLTYEKTFLGALCGMSSYQEILEMVEDAIDMGAKVLVFDQDSGGGEAYAMMSTAQSIRKRADEAGVKIISYVDGMSASASYGLSVIADEIIMHPDAQVGSVGVVIRLVNDNEARKKEGVKVQYITSAKSKVPIDEEGEFKEDFLAKLQDEVNELHSRFSSHVASFRGLTTEAVDATEANVFSAEKALEIGFADRIMDHDSFYEYLADLQEKGNQDMPLSIFKRAESKTEAKLEEVVDSAINENEVNENMKLAELQAQVDELSTKLELSENETLAALEENEKLKADLTAANEELASLQGEIKNKELAEKKQKLSAVLSEDKVDSVFEAVKELPEEAFEAIVSSYEASNQALQETEMFTEVGVDFESNQNAEAKSKSVMNLIKSRKK